MPETTMETTWTQCSSGSRAPVVSEKGPEADPDLAFDRAEGARGVEVGLGTVPYLGLVWTGDTRVPRWQRGFRAVPRIALKLCDDVAGDAVRIESGRRDEVDIDVAPDPEIERTARPRVRAVWVPC